MSGAPIRVGFLGPPGTFTEEALFTQPDLTEADAVPIGSMFDVLAAVAEGAVDLGFVAMENSIQGTLNVTLDSLIFERELYILREVVLSVTHNMRAPPRT